jgi:plastocyanin
MNENATVTFTEPGVYVIVCKPHADNAPLVRAARSS